MEKVYNVNFLRFEKDLLIISIDNQIYSFKLKDISDKLAKASEKEKQSFRILPSGYGIHWDLIDEDLSLNGILMKHNSSA